MQAIIIQALLGAAIGFAYRGKTDVYFISVVVLANCMFLNGVFSD